MNVLVVGAGEMGRWFGRVVRDGLDAPVDLAVADADPAVADATADALDARAVPLEIDERFELVCIAVPIPAAPEAIAEFADNATTAMADLAGYMAGPLAAMSEHVPECERISLHPLFAADNAPGNVAAVVENGGEITGAIRNALLARGNEWVETDAATHDEAMETVQASAHAAVLAFALAAREVPQPFHTPISAGLFDLVEQVTGNDPRVYADIQETFEGAHAVADAACEIADADRDAFEALYTEAGDG
ncbi:prephenate dehydrogenase/arogenate dehydrogenase family protein [Halapricum desulfuricans]|uniref:Prephenate dehydrogenase n=1 Tax=Halapricum desulfuricans TaxID=2841257 RepID=A0A897N1J5_9EURY|nr:prephenate dehydrogenase/arogenate dehydrogenase family protein [Halapricum desulfuricans]QSG06587.1 Prephenate dehydrogenase [Halapricum desulfuricans]